MRVAQIAAIAILPGLFVLAEAAPQVDRVEIVGENINVIRVPSQGARAPASVAENADSERREFISEMQRHLTVTDIAVEGLDAMTWNMSLEDRAELNRAIGRIQARQDILREELRQMMQAPRDVWTVHRAEALAALQNLQSEIARVSVEPDVSPPQIQ